MTEQQHSLDAAEEPRIHPLQEMMDNIWLIFFGSALVTLVFYVIWGLIDLVGRPALP